MSVLMMLEPAVVRRVEIGDDCWLWTGAVNTGGYPHICRKGQNYRVHRLTFALAYGELEAGMLVHHRCEVKRCVNPAHLEALTYSEHNKAHGNEPPTCRDRKTHCPHGHSYDELNTGISKGIRRCLTCCRQQQNARNARLRQQKINEGAEDV